MRAAKGAVEAMALFGWTASVLEAGAAVSDVNRSSKGMLPFEPMAQAVCAGIRSDQLDLSISQVRP